MTESNVAAGPTVTAQHLIKTAGWLEGQATRLRREMEVQTSIDPEWTTVELRPGWHEVLTGGIELTAQMLHVLAEQLKATRR
jgi:hypothetical protein